MAFLTEYDYVLRETQIFCNAQKEIDFSHTARQVWSVGTRKKGKLFYFPVCALRTDA